MSVGEIEKLSFPISRMIPCLHRRERQFRRGETAAIWWCEQVAAREVVSKRRCPGRRSVEVNRRVVTRGHDAQHRPWHRPLCSILHGAASTTGIIDHRQHQARREICMVFSLVSVFAGCDSSFVMKSVSSYYRPMKLLRMAWIGSF
jgi:hypothetical protein